MSSQELILINELIIIIKCQQEAVTERK